MSIRVPILTYHSVDNSGSVLSMSPKKFRSQMQILQNKQFNIISLGRFVNCIRNHHPIPKKTAIITFDDGFKNFSQKAYPILQEFRFSATVFIVPGYIGKSSQWNATLKGIPVLDVLGWDEIKKMAESGIDFGAHSMTHKNLSRLPLEDARQEILSSKLILQKNLGREIIVFSYPYGILNREIKAIVRSEFQGACGTCMDFASLNSDIYELPRIDMFYFSTNAFFRYLDTYMFSFYIYIRQVLRSIKNKDSLVY